MTVDKCSLAVPTAKTDLVYNGAEQIGVSEDADKYSVSNGKATKADTYTATVTLTNNDYKWSDSSFNGKITWSIAKANSVIDVSNVVTSYTYNGETQTINSGATLNHAEKTLVYSNNTFSTVAEGNGKVVTVSVEESDNYKSASTTVTIAVAKAKVTVPTAQNKLVYTGSEQTGVANDNLYTVTDGAKTGAGDYNATVTLKDTDNYEWATSFDGKIAWSIAKATYDMSGVTFESNEVVYDGKVRSLTIGGTLPNGVTVTYDNNGKTDKGEYTVVAKFVGDYDNYNVIDDMTAKLTIKAKNITGATVVLGERLIYNGSEQTQDVTNVTIDDLTVTYTVSGNVGTKAKSYALTVTANGNFTGTATKDWSIAKSKVTVPTATSGLVYNGTEQTGVADNSLYTVEVGKKTNAGNYTANIALKDTENYEWGTEFNGEIAWSIAKANSVIDVSNVVTSYTYNGETQTINSGATLNHTEKTLVYSNNTFTTVAEGNGKVVTVSVEESDNYTSASETVTLAVAKATYDMNGVTFESNEVVYDGKVHSLTIGGTLPNGVTVSYENNAQTESGNYTVTAKFSGDSDNYNVLSDKSATLTIKAKDIAGATVVLGERLVYNGSEQMQDVTNVTIDDLTVTYTVSDNVGTNVDSYVLTVTANGNFTGTVTADWSIAKADYDMSGVSFGGGTFIYDGTAKSIYVSGELPDGVTVTYENNGKTESGVYTVTAKFIGDYDNYNVIPDMTATITVRQASIEKVVEGGDATKPDVIVEETGGSDPDVRLFVEKQEEVSAIVKENIKRNEVVSAVYDITLKSDGVTVQPSGNLTVRLRIPDEAAGRTFRIVHLHGEEVTDVEYTIDGDYAVFTVDKLSEFSFVIDNGGSAWWLILIFAAIVAAEIVLIVLKKKKNKKNNACLAAAAFGGIIPVYEIVLLAILGVAAVALGVYVVYLYFPRKKAGEKNVAATESDNCENVSATSEEAESVVAATEETAVNEPDDDETAFNVVPELMTEEDAALARLNIRFNRSFTAKLILSSDETKGYFAEIANYLLSFKKVKSRMSWKNLSFNRGRIPVSKLAMRGKTLWIYLALDPKEFIETKYGGEDFSDSVRYEKVPYAVKIKSDRGLKYAKELIDVLMSRLGIERGEDVDTYAASDYPYDSQYNLIKRGLIKVYSDKEITDETELAGAKFDIRGSVNASEAKTLIDDVTAKKLVTAERDETSGFDGNKGKAHYAINIDTLSDNFSDGETVTLTALKEKGLVPKKENAIKILARGTLDKPLTVIADNYSADAIKMIVLTGGKAIIGNK